MSTTDQSRPVPRSNRALLSLVAVAVVSLLTLGVGFGLLALEVDLFWVAFPVGYGGLLPVALAVVALLTRPSRDG